MKWFEFEVICFKSSFLCLSALPCYPVHHQVTSFLHWTVIFAAIYVSWESYVSDLLVL